MFGSSSSAARNGDVTSADPAHACPHSSSRGHPRPVADPWAGQGPGAGAADPLGFEEHTGSERGEVERGEAVLDRATRSRVDAVQDRVGADARLQRHGVRVVRRRSPLVVHASAANTPGTR